MPQTGVMALLLGLFLGFMGCGGDANAPDAGCDDNVAVSVGAGLTPTFRWVPQCAVSDLVVLAGEGPPTFEQVSALWSLASPPDRYGLPNNRLHSGVVYGQPPMEGGQASTAVPLAAGTSYTVYVEVYTVDQRKIIVGWRTFTP